MKLLLDQKILEIQGDWEQQLQLRLPYLRVERFSKLSDVLGHGQGEKCLIISLGAQLLNRLQWLKTIDDSAFPIMAIASADEIRQLQKAKLPLAGFVLDSASFDDLLEVIQQYQLAFRPVEFTNPSITKNQSLMQEEESMAPKDLSMSEINVGEIEIGDSSEVNIELDDGALELGDADSSEDELVLDSSIDESVGELEVEASDEGLSLSLDSGDDEESLSLGDSGDDQSTASDENEIDLSFGGIELDTSDDEGESSGDSLVFSVGDNKTSSKVMGAASSDDDSELNLDFALPESDGDEAIEINEEEVPEINFLENDEDETLDTASAEAEEQDDQDLLFGDTLEGGAEDVSDEEEEELAVELSENDGTAEFDLSDSSQDEETNEQLAIPEDLPEDDIPAPVPEKTPTRTVINTASEVESRPQSFMVRDKVDYHFDENEMVRLQVTLRGLKEEREKLLSTVAQQKKVIEELESNNIGLKAETDDQKIEIALLKKRFHEKSEDADYNIRLSEEKRLLYEERMRKMQAEFDQLNQKVRLDLTRVKQREKELESQLELVKMDADAQIKGRDQKIMELKRKIDSLEFNMENMAIREQQSKELHGHLEAKVQKLMGTLKGSMKILEEDSTNLSEAGRLVRKSDEDKY